MSAVNDRNYVVNMAIYSDCVRLGYFNGAGNSRARGTDRIRANWVPTVGGDNYYRVCVRPDNVSVLYLEFGRVDDGVEGEYHSVDDLPAWMQKQLAVLNMLSYSPPTANVKGVGRRISADTYWVEKPNS